MGTARAAFREHWSSPTKKRPILRFSFLAHYAIKSHFLQSRESHRSFNRAQEVRMGIAQPPDGGGASEDGMPVVPPVPVRTTGRSLLLRPEWEEWESPAVKMFQCSSRETRMFSPKEMKALGPSEAFSSSKIEPFQAIITTFANIFE